MISLLLSLPVLAKGWKSLFKGLSLLSEYLLITSTRFFFLFLLMLSYFSLNFRFYIAQSVQLMADHDKIEIRTIDRLIGIRLLRTPLPLAPAMNSYPGAFKNARKTISRGQKQVVRVRTVNLYYHLATL